MAVLARGGAIAGLDVKDDGARLVPIDREQGRGGLVSTRQSAGGAGLEWPSLRQSGYAEHECTEPTQKDAESSQQRD